MKVFYLQGLSCSKFRHNAAVLLIGLRDKLCASGSFHSLKNRAQQQPSPTAECLAEEILILDEEIDLFYKGNAIEQEKDEFCRWLVCLLSGKRKTLSELPPEEISKFLIRFKEWSVFSYDNNGQIDHHKGGTGYA